LIKAKGLLRQPFLLGENSLFVQAGIVEGADPYRWMCCASAFSLFALIYQYQTYNR
jgi:hypothetical protein